MSYELEFLEQALDEWRRLDGSIRNALKKKLAERLENPHVPSARLSGALSDCYKIKLKRSGYRLVYRVDDGVMTVLVIAVGRRDRSRVYQSAGSR